MATDFNGKIRKIQRLEQLGGLIYFKNLKQPKFPSDFKTMQYSAITPIAGEIRRIFFEAADIDEARRIAAGCNAGLEGEAQRPEVPVPLAYNMKETQKLLGGISRPTVYAWLKIGRLDRVGGTSKVLVTLDSIERAVRE